MRLGGDELSDVRVVEGQLLATHFMPQRYYRPGVVFWGLGRGGEGVYDDDADWLGRHQRFVGPTQTGKGVVLGCQLDQAIRKGHCVVFIDPKPDKHVRGIMAKACEESGRRLVVLDLREEGKGRYGPFFGGEARDRRQRLVWGLDLGAGGTDADFYKVQERELVDSVFDKWDGTLGHLQKLFEEMDERDKDKVARSRGVVKEMLRISTFSTSKSRPGFSVGRSLREGAVVYVRGDLDDQVVNSACTLLITEIMQEGKRLHRERKSHVYLAVDEVAFLISERIADALATVAGFDMTVGLAYQSEMDLETLADRKAKTIAQRVRTNCKTSLYYMAKDIETAEIMAGLSGTIQKAVTFSQKTKMGRHLAETWDSERTVRRAEENLITVNDAYMLPERVGILYRPSLLARHLFTCWVEVDLKVFGDEEDRASGGGLGASAVGVPGKDVVKVDKRARRRSVKAVGGPARKKRGKAVAGEGAGRPVKAAVAVEAGVVKVAECERLGAGDAGAVVKDVSVPLDV